MINCQKKRKNKKNKNTLPITGKYKFLDIRILQILGIAFKENAVITIINMLSDVKKENINVKYLLLLKRISSTPPFLLILILGEGEAISSSKSFLSKVAIAAKAAIKNPGRICIKFINMINKSCISAYSINNKTKTVDSIDKPIGKCQSILFFLESLIVKYANTRKINL